MNADWTPLRRVLTTLGHQEPDRVPLLLTLTMHGAKELGLSIQEYYSKPEYMLEGQLRLYARYGHDCLMGYAFAGAEMTAWGSEPIYFDDGSPNAGPPVIHAAKEINALEAPDIGKAPLLQDMLSLQRGLKARVGDEVPIVGLVVSPVSLPVMQMGFPAYIRLLYEDRAAAERLIRINEAFCVAWAKAQLAAGATVIAYADPISSPTMVGRTFFAEVGLPSMRRTLSQIPGPVAVTYASADSLPLLDRVPEGGAVAATVGSQEDLAAAKALCRGRLTVIGNLNNVAMPTWTPEQAEAAVKAAIAQAGPGGGFVLCDQHGEIPWQTPDEVIQAIADATRRWGRYPLDWIAHDQ